VTKKRAWPLLLNALLFETPPPLTPTLAALKQSVETLAKQIGRSWYSIGVLYRDAVNRKAWTGSSYRNVDQFWINNIKSVDLRQVRKYAKIAGVYSPDIVVYDIAKLDLFITWARLNKIALGGDPGPTIVKWTANGVDFQKPFAECTEKDMQNALATARKRPGHGTAPKPPPADDLVRACLDSLKAKLAPIVADDPTYDLHAWMDGDVDGDGREEVVLRADSFVFFEACLAIGQGAKDFFASIDPATGKPRRKDASASVRRRK
jgi:hypothetical protein